MKSLSSELPFASTIWLCLNLMNVDLHKYQRERLERVNLTPRIKAGLYLELGDLGRAEAKVGTSSPEEETCSQGSGDVILRERQRI